MYNFSGTCRCVDNTLITYDENKAKADTPTHSLNNITHKYNTIATRKKNVFFLFSR